MKRNVLFVLMLIVLLGGCSSRKMKADRSIYIGPDKDLSINSISFSVKKMDSRKEVKPEKPSGYYHYYEKHKGYYYYVISGQAVNKGPYVLHADNLLVQGIHKSKSYEGKLLFSNPEKSNFVNEIKKDEELQYFFIMLIKDGSPPPDKIEIYYTKDFEALQENHQYDERLVWTLPPA